MMASDGDLETDLQELRGMLEKAQRPNVRKELQRVLVKLEAEAEDAAKAKKADAAPAAPSPAAAAATPAASPAADSKPVRVQVKPAGPWTEITTFALDLGGYDKPHVSVDVRLKGVENLPSEAVTCDFTDSSFDLKVVGLDGQNHRMVKTNLDKDIVPGESSVRVKKNHVVVMLQKVKGQYGYDSWVDLVAKGKRRLGTSSAKSENPQDSIMGMMKDLYDDGDDNMKKIIGEAMTKAHRGEKFDPKADSDVKMPKLGGGLDDL